MKKIIHVHQARIKGNTKNGTCEPPIIVRTYKGARYGHRVQLVDKDGTVLAELLHSPKKPLNCGARVWLETSLDVVVLASPVKPPKKKSA